MTNKQSATLAFLVVLVNTWVLQLSHSIYLKPPALLLDSLTTSLDESAEQTYTASHDSHFLEPEGLVKKAIIPASTLLWNSGIFSLPNGGWSKFPSHIRSRIKSTDEHHTETCFDRQIQAFLSSKVDSVLLGGLNISHSSWSSVHKPLSPAAFCISYKTPLTVKSSGNHSAFMLLFGPNLWRTFY